MRKSRYCPPGVTHHNTFLQQLRMTDIHERLSFMGKIVYCIIIFKVESIYHNQSKFRLLEFV